MSYASTYGDDFIVLANQHETFTFQIALSEGMEFFKIWLGKKQAKNM